MIVATTLRQVARQVRRRVPASRCSSGEHFRAFDAEDATKPNLARSRLAFFAAALLHSRVTWAETASQRPPRFAQTSV